MAIVDISERAKRGIERTARVIRRESARVGAAFGRLTGSERFRRTYAAAKRHVRDNPDSAMRDMGIGELMRFTAAYEAEAQRERAKRPRRRTNNPPLWRRGLECVLDEEPEITAQQLIDRIDADGTLTYDDADIELRLDGDDVTIRELVTDERARIVKDQLRIYLSRARNS